MIVRKLSASDARSRSHPVQEDMLIQHGYWSIERAGAWMLLIIVVLTLLGLFSRGPLSTVQAGSQDGDLKVEYERFLRNGATFTMVVDVHGKPGAEQRLNIGGELLEGTTIEAIQPEPTSTATYLNSGLSLLVKPDAQGKVRIHFSLRADGVGLYRSTVSTQASKVELTQFIYP